MMATIIAVAITYRCRSSVMPTMIPRRSAYADKLLSATQQIRSLSEEKRTFGHPEPVAFDPQRRFAIKN
jgi:hypothetical protein